MKAEPGKFRRNARPAATAITVLRILTVAARVTERLKLSGMLAIWPGSQISANHTREKPVIGKVTPPFSPWNDST